MLRVTVKTEPKQKEILKKAPQLNKQVTDQSRKNYINPDFTPKERELNKRLRAERKERYERGEKDLVIRDGNLVKKRTMVDNGEKPDSSNDN